MGGKEGGEREGGRWMEGEREKNTGERRVERGETERERYGKSARGKELKSEKDRESQEEMAGASTSMFCFPFLLPMNY